MKGLGNIHSIFEIVSSSYESMTRKCDDFGRGVSHTPATYSQEKYLPSDGINAIYYLKI